MAIAGLYDQWAASYDTVADKTRDLEAQALRSSLPAGTLGRVLELGCVTGKNTVWLAQQATQLTAIDFSIEMMQQARQKLADHQQPVTFARPDITQPWQLPTGPFDLITCSLLLEHIQSLDFTFGQAREVLQPGGLFYIGELHPFKQYAGSKARFETESGTVELETYVHHISDFTEAARRYEFRCEHLRE